MRRANILGFILAMMMNTASAQEGLVRAKLEIKDTPWVGQKITLVVELLAPGFFSGGPSFDVPRVPGVLVIPPEGSPVVGSEEIGGVSYTVQRHELSVFGQRAGGHDIPAFAVRFAFKHAPLDKDPMAQRLMTPPLHFETKLPPGAEKLGTIISARDLKVEETWKPEPGKTQAKAGDAFVRTITFSAPDVSGMAFPPFPAPEVDGLGIYPKAPLVMDHSERGQMQGGRQDIISYQCKRPGHFVIPAARFTWWDLDAQQLKAVDFPARSFDVAPNSALASEAAANTRTPSRVSWIIVTLLVGGVSFFLWVGLNFGGPYLTTGWERLVIFFRPIHLQPLNPPPRGGQR